VILKALPRTVSFAYPATLDYLNEVTELVRQATLAYGSDFAYQAELAASELATNVIRHAYDSSPGEMRGQITLRPDRIQLDLYDDGASFDPAELPELDPDQPREGGYGLSIVRQLADRLSYTPGTPDGNRWRLVKLVEPD
jgi:anti-sigma regulatory factor (Ser/Thr protein kinase)